MSRFGEPFKLKLSINHYLLERDKGLIPLAVMLKSVMAELGGDREVIFNVRLRKGEKYGDDAWIKKLVHDAGLDSHWYGLATDESDWEEPYTVTDDFVLINPDGTAQGTDLVRRSLEMDKLK